MGDEMDDVLAGLDRAQARVQLRMVRRGYDFETHGGLDVRYMGPVPEGGGEPGDLYPPIGTKGVVGYTKKGMFGMDECVQVAWEPWRPDTYHVLYHSWAELEVVRGKDAE